MSTPRFDLYVALGDSTTEGIDDPYPDGTYRGWADRLAEHLAGVNPGLRYANLAVRGRKIGQIHDTQLEAALALKPDLASVIGGVNDILRRRVDLDRIAETMDRMQSRLAAAGATVLTMTLPDLSESMAVARLVRERVERYNALMREVARRNGAVLVDMAAAPTATHPVFWSADRLHASAEGHARIAALAARALGVPNVGDAEEPPPHVSRGALRSLPEDVAWAWRHLRPWIVRRLRGRSSGDGLQPKRPVPTPVGVAAPCTGV